MPDRSGAALRHYEMRWASWLNMALGLGLLALSPLEGIGSAPFWSAVVTGGVVVLMETFDEWAEHADLEANNVAGPEAVVVLGGAWLIGFPFFVATGMVYQVATTVIGVVLVGAGGFNLVTSARMGEGPARPPTF